MSPTQRSLAECKRQGWTAQVVERWNPHAHVRQDLFGCIDIIAIIPSGFDRETGNFRAGGILGIQCTSSDHHSDRLTKVREEPRIAEWRKAGGLMQVWSWGKKGARGKRKTWTLRTEDA